MIHFANLGHRDYEASSGGPAPVTILFVPCGGKFGLQHGLWRQTNLDTNLSHWTHCFNRLSPSVLFFFF